MPETGAWYCRVLLCVCSVWYHTLCSNDAKRVVLLIVQLTVSVVSLFCNLQFGTLLAFFYFSQFLAIPRLSSEGHCSAPSPANTAVVQEDEEEEWEPVDRDHVVKFFQVINAQSHTQMVRETITLTNTLYTLRLTIGHLSRPMTHDNEYKSSSSLYTCDTYVSYP